MGSEMCIRDSTNRISMSHHVVTALEGYYADALEYPPNPIPGRACHTATRGGNYHADCLKEIRPFLSEEHLNQLFGITTSNRENLLQYHDYSNSGASELGAIVKVQLESPGKGNPCSFVVGSWCNESRPGFETAYCLCTGNPEGF